MEAEQAKVTAVARDCEAPASVLMILSDIRQAELHIGKVVDSILNVAPGVDGQLPEVYCAALP